MNVALGGSLNQNIPSHWQDAPSDFLSHEMIVDEDSILYPIYGKKTVINSFHHQSLKKVADDLKVIARDPRDGTIEAVVSTNEAIPFWVFNGILSCFKVFARKIYNSLIYLSMTFKLEKR